MKYKFQRKVFKVLKICCYIISCIRIWFGWSLHSSWVITTTSISCCIFFTPFVIDFCFEVVKSLRTSLVDLTYLLQINSSSRAWINYKFLVCIIEAIVSERRTIRRQASSLKGREKTNYGEIFLVSYGFSVQICWMLSLNFFQQSNLLFKCLCIAWNWKPASKLPICDDIV